MRSQALNCSTLEYYSKAQNVPACINWHFLILYLKFWKISINQVGINYYFLNYSIFDYKDEAKIKKEIPIAWSRMIKVAESENFGR